MICLPRLVWPFGTAAKNEFIPIPVGHRPFQGESDKCRIKGENNFPDRRVARRWQLALLRVGDGEAVQCCKAWARAGQRQPFDERHGVPGCAADTSIGARVSIEGRDAAVSVGLVPALQRSNADPRFPGDDSERNLVLDMKSKSMPPMHTVHDAAKCLCSRGQR